MNLKKTLAAFGYRDYRLSFIGQHTSLFGMWMQASQIRLIEAFSDRNNKVARMRTAMISSYHVLADGDRGVVSDDLAAHGFCLRQTAFPNRRGRR